MKITIIDAFHDSDRGGTGILAGLLDTLLTIERKRKENMEITIIYRFSADDERFRTAARHTSRLFPTVSIYGAPMSTYRSHNGVRRKFETVFQLLQSIIKLMLPWLFTTESAVAAIQTADYVISKGGHFYQFQSANFVKGFISAYHGFYTLLLALRLKKKVFFVAHSVGPFKSFGSRAVARFVLNRVSFLSVREEISKEILVGIGIQGEKVYVLPDTAFALKPASKEELDDFLKINNLTIKKYAVLTPRYWDFPQTKSVIATNLYENYITKLAEIADYLVTEGYVDKVVLVRHNDGQHFQDEDDARPISEVFGRITHKDSAMLIEEDLSPTMQSAFYGGSKITIGTRLHSVIFALVGGAPALAIGYTHKTIGIMKMLGLGEYVLDISSFTLSDAQKKIERLLAEEANVMATATSRIQSFRSLLQTTLEDLLF